MRGPKLVVTALSLLLASLLGAGACDSATGSPSSGTVTVGKDQGIHFANARLVTPGSYANADLIATDDGDSGLRLSTGGKSPTDNRPVTWFKTGGGIAQTFPDLVSVPSVPLPVDADPMLHAKTGFGFLLVADDGDYVRGWLQNATPSEVTIQWSRVVLTAE